MRKALVRVYVTLTLFLGTVHLGRPLGFVVTAKTRSGARLFPWRLVWPQVVATVALVVACVVGVVRLLVHAQSSTVGTAVNVTWVAYDLLVMSVIYQAALHRAPVQTEETS